MFFLLLGFAPLLGVQEIAASAESEACGKEIDLIDKQIIKLEQQKKIHQDLARKYQKQGDEWKYHSGSIHDAYAYWGRAAEERKKAIDFQNQVDVLLERRSRIIQFYPELYKPAP
jgi:hypothetical protein